MYVVTTMLISFCLLTPIYGNSKSDSISSNNFVEIKLLNYKISSLENELKEIKESNKNNQIQFKQDVEKIINEKNAAYDQKFNLYVAFFLALLTSIGAIIRYFGKDTIEKWVKQQIELYLQSKVSDTSIDNKITELGKPIIEKLLAQIEGKKIEYEVLLDELKKSKPSYTDANKEKLQEFSKILDEVKNEDIFSAWDWYIKGLEQANNYNFHQAINYYSKAIEKDPTIGNFYCNRGHSKYFTERYEDAILDYDKAIEIGNPEEKADSFSGKAASLNKLKKYSEAIINSNKSIEINSKFANVFKHRAYAKFKLKMFNEALQDINEAINLDDNYPLALDLKNDIERELKNKKNGDNT